MINAGSLKDGVKEMNGRSSFAKKVVYLSGLHRTLPQCPTTEAAKMRKITKHCDFTLNCGGQNAHDLLRQLLH